MHAHMPAEELPRLAAFVADQQPGLGDVEDAVAAVPIRLPVLHTDNVATITLRSIQPLRRGTPPADGPGASKRPSAKEGVLMGTSENLDLGETIEYYRTRLGLTQRQFGELCGRTES